VSESQPRVRRFREDPERSELDAALLVAGLIADDVDAVEVRATLSALAGDAAIGDAADLVQRVADLGFAGAPDYYALDNSRIDRVLATRRGIPITLAIVYIELGRRCGREVRGVGFPGHFLVDVDGVLVDPFNHRALSEVAFAALASQHSGIDPTRLRAHATVDEIALRMINNAKGVLLALRGDSAVPELMGLLDAQLVLGGDPTSLHVERAELWRRLGSADGMRSALVAAREGCTAAALAREIDRRLAALPKGRSGPLH
jgi:regulator of sirC expression with transglutaminase-like and TPR domain